MIFAINMVVKMNLISKINNQAQQYIKYTRHIILHETYCVATMMGIVFAYMFTEEKY